MFTVFRSKQTLPPKYSWIKPSNLVTYEMFLISVVSKFGIVRYSEVVSFLQKEANVVAKYESITTSHNESIQLSGSHLVFARKHIDEKFNPM